MDLSTYLPTSVLDRNCMEFQYFDESGFAVCVNLNNFSLVSSSLGLLANITVSSPDTTAINSIHNIPLFSHFIITQTSGVITIYSYDTTQTIFTVLA